MRQSQQGQDLHPQQHAVLHLMKQFLLLTISTDKAYFFCTDLIVNCWTVTLCTLLLVTVRLFNLSYSTIYRPRSATADFTKSMKASTDIVPKFFLSEYVHSLYLLQLLDHQELTGKECALEYAHES